MWKRFKNWLIKRLGGYTKAEYDDWSRIPIVKPDLFSVDRSVGHTVELHADRNVYFEDVVARCWQEVELLTRAEITRELTNAVLPYITWRKIKDPAAFKMRIEATLAVLDKE